MIPDFVFKAVNAFHREIIKISGGKLGNKLYDMPMVSLITQGKSTGLPRKVLLSSPVQFDGNWVLIASKYGAAEHPQWYRNLKANPIVELELPDSPSPQLFTAREATDLEYPQLWNQAVHKYKGYAEYQKKTARKIPIVILEPCNEVR